jgi:pimeloyl-ACP methyl ester carboxylesterase
MALNFLSNPPPASEPNFWEYSTGKRLAWNEYGDPEGAPVFYYHGWPGSRLQARLAHHLAKNRSLRLIAMDRPGMAKSTLVPGRRLEDWPGLMEGFADHLGIGEFGQVGVSGGGPYVLACAAMIPDRLTGSAVLAGMVPLPLTKSGTSGLHPLYRMMIPIRKSPALLFSGLFRIAAHVSSGKPDSFPLSLLVRSLAEEDRAILLSSDEVWEVATTSFIESVSSAGCGRGVMVDSEIYFQKPSFDPAAITHPIRYWHGGDDKNIPAALVEELAGTMSHAELCVEPELGHFSLAIHRAAAALDYIAECA